MRKDLAGQHAPERSLLSDIRALIETAKAGVARTSNSALVTLYWCVGTRIREDVLRRKRADYGRRIVGTLSPQLMRDYGSGFSKDNLFRMVKFAECFPERQIVATLSRQLGWSHFVKLLPLEDPLKREFYAEMCRVERWSVRACAPKTE
jgi:predicted nuclease of restriction endonuclease-like (RecB) superfamily